MRPCIFFGCHEFPHRIFFFRENHILPRSKEVWFRSARTFFELSNKYEGTEKKIACVQFHLRFRFWWDEKSINCVVTSYCVVAVCNITQNNRAIRRLIRSSVLWTANHHIQLCHELYLRVWFGCIFDVNTKKKLKLSCIALTSLGPSSSEVIFSKPAQFEFTRSNAADYDCDLAKQ